MYSSPEYITRQLNDDGKILISQSITIQDTIDTLEYMYKQRPERKEFTLLINSSGGSPSAVCYFKSIISTFSDTKLHGVAFGECGSAALALLQCCDTRIGVNGCGFFIHNMSVRTETNNCMRYDLRTIEAEINSAAELEDFLINLQCTRSGLSREEWGNLANYGTLFSNPIMCHKAKQLGLIDDVVESYPIF